MNAKIMLTILWIITALISFTPAMGYTIDGDLSDWGLSGLNTGDWSENETWIPADGVAFVIEDNSDSRISYDFQGVHIWGTGTAWKYYNEPQKSNSIIEGQCSEPYGGEEYDMEAFYFDQDLDSIYIAIVTSLKSDGTGDKCPMDLALNFGNNPVVDDLGYEYGVKIREGATQGSIILNPVWKRSRYFYPATPGIITPGTGSYVGKADISYHNNWLTRKDNGFDNFVIEIAILKSDVGVSGNTKISNLFYSDSRMDGCIVTPEFPGVAVSLGIITGMVFVVYLFFERYLYGRG